MFLSNKQQEGALPESFLFYIFIWVYRITLGKGIREREGKIFTELGNLIFIIQCHKILSKYLLQLSTNRGKAATVRRIYTVTDQKFQASTILTNSAFLPNVIIDVISRSNFKRKRVSILLSASSLCINFSCFHRRLSPQVTELYL